MFWKEYRWQLIYFFVGTIGLIGVGRLFMPFSLRFGLLVLWALGLVPIFIRTMEGQSKRKQRNTAEPDDATTP